MGRVVREPIRKGEPFLTTNLYLEGLGPNVAEILKPGMRAVTLEVSPRTGGTVAAGTFVDVLFRSTSRPADSLRPPIPETTVTLMQGVEVVAVDRPKAQSDPNGQNLDIRLLNGRRAAPPPDPAVTIAVSLEQANILQTVEGRGEISLIPRSMEEVGGSQIDTRELRMTLESLLGAEYPDSFKTEIYRRGSKETRIFGPEELRESQRQIQEQDADPAATEASSRFAAGLQTTSW